MFIIRHRQAFKHPKKQTYQSKKNADMKIGVFKIEKDQA